MNLDELKDLAHLSLKVAQDSGAEYAEARIHGETGNGYMLKNGEAQPSILEDSFGIGIRLIYRGALAFSATNLLERSSVKDLTFRTVKLAKASKGLVDKKVSLDNSKPARANFRAPEKERMEGADSSWLKRLLGEMERRVTHCRGASAIANRILVASSSIEQKYLVNSDGASVESRVPRLHFYGVLTAMENGVVAQRTFQQGESGGMEAERRMNLVEKVEQEAVRLVEVLKKAGKSPTGVMDVVLSPELSGIAAHESVGHPQEADRILGREGAQAGESYLRSESLGKKVGSDEANISDDPTLLRSNGYSPVDDEGVRSTKRRLIKEGRVTEFLHNRSTSAELRTTNNASSRSTAYNREPIVRMSNTFVEPGDFTFEEMLKEVKEGVYLKSFTEWNIDDKRLNQRYVGLEAYQIKNGEIKGMVKAPVLEITTPALWGSVKARTKELEFEAAVCGKGDPMQGIPVWTGGPHTLLTGIRLGSR
jgi:TldD protein